MLAGGKRGSQTDNEGLRVDHRYRLPSTVDRERVADRVEPKAQLPEAVAGERGKVDTTGRARAGVEGVDERRLPGTVIERVGPAAIGADGAGQRGATHLVPALTR